MNQRLARALQGWQDKLTALRVAEVTITTEDLGNGIILEMVEIAGGKFMMGTEDREIERLCQKYDTDWYKRERPQHEVNISSFFMGKYPITHEQWRAVALSDKVEMDLKPDPSYFKGSKNPVERVSWLMAVEFCKRLSKLTGKEYKLPSEAQWEYACRAGTKSPFYLGETITTDLANYRGTDGEYQGTIYAGNYGEGPKGVFRGQTTPVGEFPPNGFGLYDMHGNVWGAN